MSALRRIGPDHDDGAGDLRPRPENCRRHAPPHRFHVGDTLHQHRQRAVILGAGARQQPLRDFPLHHDDHALEGVIRQQEIGQDRRGHRVREVRDQFQTLADAKLLQVLDSLQHKRVQMVLVLEHIGVQQRDVAAACHGLARHLHEGAINLDAEHPPGLVGQPRRQAAGAAADFQNQVFTRQLGGAQDDIEQIQVDEKTLPELVLGMNAPRLEQVAQVRQRLPRRRLGYRVMVGQGHPLLE